METVGRSAHHGQLGGLRHDGVVHLAERAAAQRRVKVLLRQVDACSIDIKGQGSEQATHDSKQSGAQGKGACGTGVAAPRGSRVLCVLSVLCLGAHPRRRGGRRA